jgi:ferredoxin
MSEPLERKIGGVTILIDRESCIGSANCVKVAPQLFELDSEQIVAFKKDPPELERGFVIEACGVCPVDALTVRDASGKRIVP